MGRQDTARMARRSLARAGGVDDDAAMRVPVAPAHVHRLLNHGPTTLVSTAHGGRRNVMAAAWVMPIDFEPCKLAAVIAADTFTRELMVASGECVVMAPTSEQIALVYAVGTCSGRDGDKFARLGIATEPASAVAAPLVTGCAAWLECRVVAEPTVQERYDLFVLECVAASADDRWWRQGEWAFAPDGPRTIHHCKGGVFYATGERLAAPR
jgi:flavin reductase (DIM6/NTAB) family NADH-FMN oxidoreductase RutF